MQSWQICGVGVIVALAAMLIRQLRAEAAVPVRLGGSVVLLGISVGLALPVLSFAERLASEVGFGDYAQVLLKAFAIALMTHIGAGLCRELGEGSVASYLELAGKCEILLLSLPLIDSVIDVARELLNWQG